MPKRSKEVLKDREESADGERRERREGGEKRREEQGAEQREGRHWRGSLP